MYQLTVQYMKTRKGHLSHSLGDISTVSRYTSCVLEIKNNIKSVFSICWGERQNVFIS